MNELLSAINATETFTENGMPTYTSSLNSAVDLFFGLGAMRGKNIIPLFSKAFNEDPVIATRLALWARDVRGGAGERQIFRDIVKYMSSKDEELVARIVDKIPELGRWDDLYSLFGTGLERQALRAIAKALNEGNGLCAKWSDRKGPNANKVRAYMKLTPKAYRQLIVGLTNVVETQMCSNEWTAIEFGKLPSVASARYQKAFGRHTPELYAAYIAGLEKGTEKINASAVYPYDVVKSLKFGNEKVADAQWKALPNYLEGSKENILPVVDVSGSMEQPIGGGNNSIMCMDVAISLGLYLSERSEGAFKDAFITFSETPQLQTVNGSLSDRYRQMKRSKWGMSTNLESVFQLVLNAAVQHKVPAESMPTQLLILSDMQFNSAVNQNRKAIDMIKARYEEAGYKVPSVVFWNLAQKSGVPVTYDAKGTALISGFSPSIMTAVLSTDDFTPVNVMLKAISNERYNF